MSNEQINMNDPLGFMRNMWGQTGFNLPGMVTPTFDIDELDKRIKDMKAVEGWLRMNLSMLQMTVQGLEMQRSTVSAVKTMGQMASDAAKSMQPEAATEAPVPNSTVNADNGGISGTVAGTTMWPWQMMEQMREQMQQHADTATQAKAARAETVAKAPRRTKK